MTRIDFYILKNDTEAARLDFCCRLVDKAMRQNNRILINTKTAASSEEIDDLLWSFRPESYVPHMILGLDEEMETEEELAEIPVVISRGLDCVSHHDVLVNLDTELPEHFAKFKRLAQIVNQDKEQLAASRKLFAFLRDRGYPIEIHNLNQ